jgi:hypothetical protein
MKFLVPNYSCLQNPLLGGYRPRSPFSLFSVLNWIYWPPPRTKFLGTPLCMGSPFKWIPPLDLYFMLKVIELIMTGILYSFILKKLDWWTDTGIQKPRDLHVSFCHLNWFTTMFFILILLTFSSLPVTLRTTRFNIQKFHMLVILHLCVLYGFQNKQYLLPYTEYGFL